MLGRNWYEVAGMHDWNVVYSISTKKEFASLHREIKYT